MEWAPGDSRGSTKYPNLEDLKYAVSRAGLGIVADGLSLEQKTAVETVHGQPSVGGNKRKSTINEEEPDSKKPRLAEN